MQNFSTMNSNLPKPVNPQDTMASGHNAGNHGLGETDISALNNLPVLSPTQYAQEFAARLPDLSKLTNGGGIGDFFNSAIAWVEENPGLAAMLGGFLVLAALGNTGSYKGRGK